MCGSLICHISMPIFQAALKQFYEVVPNTTDQKCSHSPTHLLGYFAVTQVMRWVRYFTNSLLLNTHFLWSLSALAEMF